jgi:hypothetical protein
MLPRLCIPTGRRHRLQTETTPRSTKAGSWSSAEQAWQRQFADEDAAIASVPGGTMLRILLLGAVLAIILLLLFQRLSEFG